MKRSYFRPQNAKISRCAGLEREVCYGVYAPPTLDVLPISERTPPDGLSGPFRPRAGERLGVSA